MRGIPSERSSNVTFDRTLLPGLGTILSPGITGGLHRRVIFNIPLGLVSDVKKIVTELLPSCREKPDTNYTNCHELLEGRARVRPRTFSGSIAELRPPCYYRFVSIREIRV